MNLKGSVNAISVSSRGFRWSPRAGALLLPRWAASETRASPLPGACRWVPASQGLSPFGDIPEWPSVSVQCDIKAL